MPYNRQKMENALLALIGALEFEDGRFWKGYAILTCSIACTNKA